MILSKEPRLAGKNYDQTTLLLAHSTMAAGMENWIRTFFQL